MGLFLCPVLKIYRLIIRIIQNNFIKILISRTGVLLSYSQNDNEMTATYYNAALNEIYTLRGIASLAHAWNMAEFACRRMNWNTIDISKVTVK